MMRFRPLHILFFCLFMLAARAGNAQDISFRKYTTKDGLPGNDITAIAQDHLGFIWVGTDNGLSRFDGSGFTVYRKSPRDSTTIADNSIRCLYADGKGRLWVGLPGGKVSVYDHSLDRFTNFSCIPTDQTSPDQGDVSGFTEDFEGGMWISVDRQGVVRFDPESGKTIRQYSSGHGPSGLSHNATTSISTGLDGNPWITTWGGGLERLVLPSGSFSHFTHAELSSSEIIPVEHLLCQFHAGDGKIWIGSTYYGLFCLDPAHGTWENYTGEGDGPTELGNSTVNDIAEDSSGMLWIATTRGGIAILDRKTKQIRHIKASPEEGALLSNRVNCLFRDRNGSMWVGTSSGLQFYDPSMRKFQSYDITRWGRDLPERNIQAILKLRDGDILVKGRGAVLFFHEQDGLVRSIPVPGFTSDKVIHTVMMEDRKGNVWLGNPSESITILSPLSGTARTIHMDSPWKDALPFRYVNSFYEDTDGSIWIATEIGAVNFDPESEAFRPLFQARGLIHPAEHATTILRDSRGELWVGTEQGLRRYGADGTQIATYLSEDEGEGAIPDDFIITLCEDHENTLWVGTMGGLVRFDREKETFAPFAITGEASSTAIMGIIEDDSGRLWVSASFGILEIDRNREDYRLYDENDGLQGGEFNPRVLSKGLDGELVFGGKEGFNTIHPDSIPRNTVPPDVFITGFRIFDEDIKPGDDSELDNGICLAKSAVLRHDQSMFTLRFAALDYISPGQNKFAYMLEGFDRDWIYTRGGIHQATYTHVPPGKYTFRVKAANNDGVWNEEGASLSIRVKPPLWLTWWAKALYLLLFFGALIGGIHWLLFREREKSRIEREKFQARAQHEADEQKLKFFSNVSHEFRNSLTLISGPLDSISPEEVGPHTRPMLDIMRRNTSRLLRMINQVLDTRKIESGEMTLHPETKDLVPFLRDEVEAFSFSAGEKSIGLTFTHEVESLIMNIDPDKLDKIVFNLLSNAIKYTGEGGHIAVRLHKEDRQGAEWATIRVEDDGAGIRPEDLEKVFTMFYQARDAGHGTGLGLPMSREFAILMGGNIEVESKPGKGSAFTVILPYRQTDSDVQAESIPDTDSPVVKGNGELILIVEDNEDMRLYIKRILSDGFRIMEASDGMEGFRKAAESIPDIIISDVMMPRMTGMELLDKIKSDDKTDHIPIILLTAVNDESQIVKSLKTGVDDYITKPFNGKVLRARVENILQNRKKQWERYQASNSPKQENPFVTRMRAIVTDNISNPAFGLDTLASELFMSPPQLNRKTHALMDMTPYSFITKVRMERASELLKEGTLNISQIATECGYPELSNFTRAFTKFFGMSPTNYRKERISSP